MVSLSDPCNNAVLRSWVLLLHNYYAIVGLWKMGALTSFRSANSSTSCTWLVVYSHTLIKLSSSPRANCGDVHSRPSSVFVFMALDSGGQASRGSGFYHTISLAHHKKLFEHAFVLK